ncbi:MAG: hypothetical protein QM658_16155 [Gordonia sp. (in: high G+C Gram-positive bacteria)]
MIPQYSAAPAPLPLPRFSLGRLVASTWAIFLRIWPIVIAVTLGVYAVAAVAMVLFFVVFFGLITAATRAGGPGVAVFGVLVGLLFALVLPAALSAPWLGTIISSADEVINAGRPNLKAVFARLRSRLLPLVGWYFAVTVPVMVVLTVVNVLAWAVTRSQIAGFVLVAIVVEPLLVFIYMGPWAVVFENCGPFAAVRRGVELAKSIFWPLLGCTAAWAVLNLLFVVVQTATASPAVMVIPLLFDFVFSPLWMIAVGVLYSEQRARELGREPSMALRQPAVQLKDGWNYLRGAALSAPAPAYPAAPTYQSSPGHPVPNLSQHPYPSPAVPETSTVSFASASEVRPPSGGQAFRSPPGWPQPPAGWLPGPDWRPDPSWPPAPPGWRFWG